MSQYKTIALLALCLFAFLPLAGALTINDLNDYIVFKEQPVLLQFTVTNDSASDAGFSMQVKTPASHEFLGRFPASLKKGETANITLRLTPLAGLQNTYYASLITFTLGSEITERGIQMNFLKADDCTIDFSVSAEKSATGITVYLNAKNNSVERKSYELKAINAIPSDWSVSLPKNVSLSGLETKITELNVKAGSDYKGNASAVFVCAGREIEKEFAVNYAGKKSGATGLFGLAGGINFGSVGNLAIYVVLFIIAAFLVLVFAARFIKRLNGKR
ncbi:MAG: hypothetical protein WC602_06490 [archaeon]